MEIPFGGWVLVAIGVVLALINIGKVKLKKGNFSLLIWIVAALLILLGFGVLMMGQPASV